MKKIIISAVAVVLAAGGALAQTDKKPKKPSKEKSPVVSISKNTATAPLELAKNTLKAHGGDKFKNMKTLVVRGSAELSGSPTSTFPATFATVYAGEKYRIEIINPIQPFKQTYDGQQTVSSIRGFELPPLNRLGLPLIQHLGDKDFTVSALPEKSKKNGFRITSPEGFYTDFFVDEKTGTVKSYESSYEISGRNVTTSVDITTLREVEGVKIPERYAQRFDLGQLTFYADFKAKEILVNSPVADDVFTGGK